MIILHYQVKEITKASIQISVIQILNIIFGIYAKSELEWDSYSIGMRAHACAVGQALGC